MIRNRPPFSIQIPWLNAGRGFFFLLSQACSCDYDDGLGILDGHDCGLLYMVDKGEKGPPSFPAEKLKVRLVEDVRCHRGKVSHAECV